MKTPKQSENLFTKHGTSWRVTSRQKMDLHEKLPPGNYVIQKDPFRGELFLEQIDDFEITGRLYGKITTQAKRILNTFYDRPVSTGVMLVGEKGSGKSLLAKKVCVEAAKKERVPTIVINAPWHGDDFNQFIQSIDQPCIIFFDEFEKTYDEEHQEAILTLLDGVFPTKKLFILTSNDKWKLNTHMRNRPGRVFYFLEFRGLDISFIREYCEENLKNKKHIEQVCKVATVFDSFNFDMLKALVEEMNRYNESPQDAMHMLNTKPEFASKVDYEVRIKVGNKDIPEKQIYENEWTGNPLLEPVMVHYYVPNPEWEGKDDEENEQHIDERFTLQPSDLKEVDAQKEGRFVYRKGNKTVILLCKKYKSFNYFDAF